MDIDIFETTATPTLIYTSRSQVTTGNQKNRIQTTGMRIRNTTFRKVLGTIPIINTIESPRKTTIQIEENIDRRNQVSA